MTYRVLIADDSETIRKVLAKSLALSGLPIAGVVHAANGQEAIDALAREKVDLVLTDLNMPGRTGYELIDYMANDPVWRAIPVIVISSVARGHALLHGRVRGYLTKPFFPEKVNAAVSAALEEPKHDRHQA